MAIANVLKIPKSCHNLKEPAPENSPYRGVLALYLRVVLAGRQGALFGLGGPVHALSVGEGGEVGVAVDAHVEVLAPHAEAASAVAACRSVAAGRGARRGTRAWRV